MHAMSVRIPLALFHGSLQNSETRSHSRAATSIKMSVPKRIVNGGIDVKELERARVEAYDV